tara:strand:+ start:80 stop:328 length:249 start_codon:yes stop_codon:yes gene_type:complete
MLNRKDAQMVADNHYSRKNVKNGIMATLLNSSTPVTTTGLNTMFNINSAGARVSEIVKETGYTFSKTSIRNGTRGASVAYAA